MSLLLSLPSCMTAMLWNARHHDSSTETAATSASRCDSDADGARSLVVRLADDLPAESSKLGFVFAGQWLACDFAAPAPGLTELLRLHAAGACDDIDVRLHVYGNDNAQVEARAHLAASRLGEVHVAPGLAVTPQERERTELVARISGKLRLAEPPPSDGASTAPARVAWYKHRDEAFGVPVKVVLTPVTLVMDVAMGPVVLVTIGYMSMYQWFGGRG
jgi:hypothetical protein